MKTKNFLITDRVEITGGTGFDFLLVIGIKNPKPTCENVYKLIPTWKTLIDDIIEYCIENNICLSLLASQGTIQQGDARSPLPPCAIKRIANKIIKNSQNFMCIGFLNNFQFRQAAFRSGLYINERQYEKCRIKGTKLLI